MDFLIFEGYVVLDTIVAKLLNQPLVVWVCNPLPTYYFKMFLLDECKVHSYYVLIPSHHMCMSIPLIHVT